MSRIKREVPGPGQESVWDYPRPPLLRVGHESIEIELGGQVVARTTTSWQVLETSHPPTYYLPRAAFAPGTLRPAAGHTVCEWKGRASYVDVVAGEVVAARAGWFYPDPTPAFAALRDAIAVMPAGMDRCTVDGELVRAQEGGFYGGWITDRVVGPFKGSPGSWGW
ncbi:MAG: DUF427 domain-containing protein [Actinobacteria bacterium]|uniref:Unannotated protein n=1 Tax=freshwater metagenome TaxID=449393 RepID=A0A6J6NKK6_9ZZZZ|nr:DUF427 domain-containing protein [Actinomycetota bacterium]